MIENYVQLMLTTISLTVNHIKYCKLKQVINTLWTSLF